MRNPDIVIAMTEALTTNLGGLFSAVSNPFQENTHFATLFDVYKIYALLHRSKLKSFANVDNLFDKVMTTCVKMCYIEFDEICRCWANFEPIDLKKI